MNAIKSNSYWVGVILSVWCIMQPLTSYSQHETDLIADNMLLYQRFNGGWAKAYHNRKITYDHVFSAAQKKQIKSQHDLKDATIDNKATTREINYLLKAYSETQDSAYLVSAERGLDYLLKAQYDNGGWPQYYPDSSLYRSQVTFNDNAIINVLQLLRNVARQKREFAAVDPKYVRPCREAVKRAIDCILKTQIVVDGRKTAWNQQYNKVTLLPEKARSFELVGLAASESAAIVDFLMQIPQPSDAVKDAVNSAMTWFKKVAIKGYRFEHIVAPKESTGKDAILVKDANSVIWARFYEIGTDRPFFSGRNSEKKYDLKEIEDERRAGYAWYGSWPARLIDQDYPAWLSKYGR